MSEIQTWNAEIRADYRSNRSISDFDRSVHSYSLLLNVWIHKIAEYESNLDTEPHNTASDKFLLIQNPIFTSKFVNKCYVCR